VHITRCLTPRPHNSGEAPCSFTMAPCVVVARLEGNQQRSRAPVGEQAEVHAQDAECGCHEQHEVNEKQPKPRNTQSHNHDNTAPRQHPLIYNGAGQIHPVHGPSSCKPRRPCLERIHILAGFIYLFVCAYILLCMRCIQVLGILFRNFCLCAYSYISLFVEFIIIEFIVVERLDSTNK